MGVYLREMDIINISIQKTKSVTVLMTSRKNCVVGMRDMSNKLISDDMFRKITFLAVEVFTEA